MFNQTEKKLKIKKYIKESCNCQFSTAKSSFYLSKFYFVPENHVKELRRKQKESLGGNMSERKINW